MFGNQGALWGNAMTWWDHDTGSIWSQPLGESIAGPRKGDRLELFPVQFTTWDAWREANPSTLALDAPAAVTGFDLERLLIVVEFGDEAVGYPVAEVQRLGVINDVVAGVEIAVVTDPNAPARWAVFSRRLDDRVVELVVEDGELHDLETATIWDPNLGIGRDGELAGEVLNKLAAITSFPDDYDTFWPDGIVWTP